MKNLCINCQKEAPWTWFCDNCNKVKEESYKISKEKNESWLEVVIRRDKMLKESIKPLAEKV